MFDVYKLENHRIESKFELDSIFLIHHGIKLDESTYNTVVSNELLVKLLNERSLFSLYDEFLDYAQKRDYDFCHVLNDIYDVGEIVNNYINEMVDFVEFTEKCPPIIPEQTRPIDGHEYIVFDMNEALVQILPYYGFDLGGSCWNDIIIKFTDEPYLMHQKNLRIYAFMDVLLCNNHTTILVYMENMASRIKEVKTNKILLDLLNSNDVEKIIAFDSLSFDITNYSNKEQLTKDVLSNICYDIKNEIGLSVKTKFITYHQCL